MHMPTAAAEPEQAVKMRALEDETTGRGTVGVANDQHSQCVQIHETDPSGQQGGVEGC